MILLTGNEKKTLGKIFPFDRNIFGQNTRGDPHFVLVKNKIAVIIDSGELFRGADKEEGSVRCDFIKKTAKLFHLVVYDNIKRHKEDFLIKGYQGTKTIAVINLYEGKSERLDTLTMWYKLFWNIVHPEQENMETAIFDLIRQEIESYVDENYLS